jgi:transcriptional antiterminator
MEISNKRCIQILKLLLKNKECMTGDNLAVAIGVSSRTIRNDMKDLNRALEDILYDPQTSGGLMIAVSENDAKNLLEDLQNTIPCAKIIGYIEEKEEKTIILE